jgi:hypothetical protein
MDRVSEALKISLGFAPQNTHSMVFRSKSKFPAKTGFRAALCKQACFTGMYSNRLRQPERCLQAIFIYMHDAVIPWKSIRSATAPVCRRSSARGRRGA